jgi:hypothetical protein
MHTEETKNGSSDPVVVQAEGGLATHRLQTAPTYQWLYTWSV